MKNYLLILISFILFSLNPKTYSQEHRVLFLGNSYTAVNNLPQMFLDVVESAGDTVFIDQNCPGGYRFIDHLTNQRTLNLISQGNWGYVVLQEQSQMPAFPIQQVQQEVFPYAKALDSLINLHNGPCVETAFYMTWGRKNGDQQNCNAWPPVCTYEGMDSLLNLRYMIMAKDNNAIVSPVGAVWRQIRNQFPNIELYSSDGSHPSVAGTYAAACTFYTAIFRKDPTLITFNANLDEEIASNIKNVVKYVLHFNLEKYFIGKYDSTLNIACDTSTVNTTIDNNIFDIYPNPSSDIIYIKKNQNIIDENCEIYSFNGKLIRKYHLLPDYVDISEFPKGVYFFKLNTKNIILKKFIKQ